MKTRSSAIFAVAILGLVFSVTSHAAPLDTLKGENGELKIAGGTAHIPVMKEAAARIMGLNPDIQISITGGGSAGLASNGWGKGWWISATQGVIPVTRRSDNMGCDCSNGPLTG